MRFSLNFIEEFLKISVKPQKLAELLTMAGMEVEHLEKRDRDWIYDIEVTTNRYDWLSMLGIAREVSAVLGKKLKVQYPPLKKGAPLKERKIMIESLKDCPYYIGRSIRGVKQGVQHKWLRERVENCGINSIGTVVDITNYCMLKWGNPLHAFDSDKLKGDVYIRRASPGELFIGIDDRERKLTKENLVVADQEKVVALAGVMGAKNTEVDENTRDVFLEAAVFSPLTVRRSRRAIGLDTESSYRFERMVSGVNLEYASGEAARLIQQLCSATSAGFRSAGSRPRSAGNKITLKFSQLDAYLGAVIPKNEVKRILNNLGLGVKPLSGDKVSVSVNVERFDLESAVDLYEEIGRIYGYAKIPSQTPFLTAFSPPAQPDLNIYQMKNDLRGRLALLGFKEIITYSMDNQEELAKISEAEIIKIINPLRSQEGVLRNNLSLGMIKALRHNLNRSQKDLRFFEVADVYSKNKKGFIERPVLSLGVSAGPIGSAIPQAFFSLKAAVEKIICYLNIEEYDFQESEVKSSSNALVLYVAGEPAGFLGKLNQQIRQDLDLREDIFLAELDLIALGNKRNKKKYKTFSPYPAIWRDISLALDKKVKFKEIEKVIRLQNLHLSDLAVVDIYKGKDTPSDKHIFTLRLFYQSSDKTLTAQEVDSCHEDIRNRLKQKEGVTLR